MSYKKIYFSPICVLNFECQKMSVPSNSRSSYVTKTNSKSYFCVHEISTLSLILLTKAIMTQDIEDFFFFSVKDRNLFHRVDTISNISTRGANILFISCC